MSSTNLITDSLPDPFNSIFSTFWLLVSPQRVVGAPGLNLPVTKMYSNVLRMANNLRCDEDVFFSSYSSLSEKEKSGIPSTEYEATAKSDASLAIMAVFLLPCVLEFFYPKTRSPPWVE
jgi:hypothetical protein